MCLSVPMKIEEIDGLKARCSAMGEERWADLMLLQSDLPIVGEYILISLGFAQSVVSEHDALQAYEMFDEILQALEGQSQD
ncbi:MAG: HypC/HybG/HupF family hydrogenase formation chaperone [Rhodospirillaceae bacterium]|jgi:hydrogenase expression/formation protein HypC|nr:HypC/HybG/HupF family hydrogenase formation chaperone [Rhodospirillaceae bacterium]